MFENIKFSKVDLNISTLATILGTSIYDELLNALSGKYEFAKILVKERPDLTPQQLETAAHVRVVDFIKQTSHLYLSRAEYLTNKLNNITQIKVTVQENRTTGNEQQKIDEPVVSSTIRKMNETPQAGNNPDLLTDTYLSESERFSTREELKQSLLTGTSEDTATRITQDDFEIIKLVSEIKHDIMNLYVEWANSIAREFFVI